MVYMVVQLLCGLGKLADWIEYVTCGGETIEMSRDIVYWAILGWIGTVLFARFKVRRHLFESEDYFTQLSKTDITQYDVVLYGNVMWHILIWTQSKLNSSVLLLNLKSWLTVTQFEGLCLPDSYSQNLM